MGAAVRAERARTEGLAARPGPAAIPSGTARSRAWRIAMAAGAVLGAMALYTSARAIGGLSDAADNAAALASIEAALGIDVGPQRQRWLLQRAPLLVRTADVFYALAYWPVVIGVAAGLWWRRRASFRWLRDVVALSGLVGIVTQSMFPVTPPRLLAGHVDTLASREVLGSLAHPPFVLNEHAAFPSFHVAWFAAALLALRHGRARRWRHPVVVAPAALMSIAVVVTANHFVLDVLAGLLLLAASVTVVDRWHGRRRRVGDRGDARPGAAVAPVTTSQG